MGSVDACFVVSSEVRPIPVSDVCPMHVSDLCLMSGSNVLFWRDTVCTVWFTLSKRTKQDACSRLHMTKSWSISSFCSNDQPHLFYQFCYPTETVISMTGTVPRNSLRFLRTLCLFR